MSTLITTGTSPNDKRAIGTLGIDTENAPSAAMYYGLAGADVIQALASASIPYAVLGTGNDAFTALFNGLATVAIANGAEGNDTLSGGDGSGPEGVPRLIFLYGGTGDDSLTGGDGSDGLFGDAYDDVLNFTGWYLPEDTVQGVDTLVGGPDDDLLVGGRLGDSMNGGNGVDMFVWESPEEFGDTIAGFAAGAGGDRLFFNNLITTTPGTTQSQYVRFQASGGNTLVQIDRDGPGATHTWQDVATLLGVSPGSIAQNQVAGLFAGQTVIPARYTVVASEWADTISRSSFGSDEEDFYPLYTLGGDDNVSALLGNFGLGDGNDTFTALASPFGGGGFPIEFPGGELPLALGSMVNGGRGTDTLTGGSSADTLTGGSGGDSILGGGGADHLFGDGYDDQVLIAYLAPENVLPTSGADTILGGAGRDLIVGGGGTDQLRGEADSDLFVWEYSGTLGDTISGFESGASGDRLFLGQQVQPAAGLGFADYVWTQSDSGQWRIYFDPDGRGAGGGPAAPVVVANLVDSGASPSLNLAQLPGFVAAAGSLVTATAGTPVTLDPAGVSIGTYWADAWSLSSGQTFDYSTFHALDGNDVVATALAGAFYLGRGDDSFSTPGGSFTNSGTPLEDSGLSVSGDQGNDTITGSVAGDDLTGGSGADSIDGGGGNDSIYGDYVDGGVAITAWAATITTDGETVDGGFDVAGDADTIRGGDGDDVIVGGEGADDLDGGAGADLFVYERTGDFGDLIRNFATGSDRILLNGLIRLQPGLTSVTDYVSKQASGSDTQIVVDLDAGGGEFSPQVVATLQDVSPANVNLASSVLLGEEFRGLLPDTGENSPPSVPSETVVPMNEDGVLQGQLPAATDEDGDPLTYSLVTAPLVGSASVSSNGSFTFTPPVNYSGEVTLQFLVSDDAGGSTPGTLRVAVNPVNDPPTGEVVVAGSAVVGQRVEAFSSLGDPDGLPSGTGSLSHRWEFADTAAATSWTLVPGSTTASRLDLGQDLTGKYVRYTISYTDQGGTAESLSSTPIGPVGGSAPNTITGTPQPDSLVGTAGADMIVGLASDDTIRGAGGNDIVDGGDGTDTAVASGVSSRYSLTFSGANTTLVDSSGADGTDTLTWVEKIQFTDKTVIVERGTPTQSYDGLPVGLYHFFIVAFDAAPGVTYMDQLAEAYRFFQPQLGDDALRTIVEIFTTKTQFTDVYPLSLGNRALATELVARIVKGSASDAAKAEAVNDIEGALGLGWSRGKVIFTVFGNLANKPFNDPTWGGTAQQFDRQIDVAKVYSEALLQSTTHLETLRSVLAPVTPATDVSTEAKIVELIGNALLDGPGV